MTPRNFLLANRVDFCKSTAQQKSPTSFIGLVVQSNRNSFPKKSPSIESNESLPQLFEQCGINLE